MRKAQKLKIQAIQKEQMQLVQIEKCLEEMVGNINESINTLKVEELQLKSSLVEHFTMGGTTTTAINHYEQEQKPSTSIQAATAGGTSWLKPEDISSTTLTRATNDDVGVIMDESINQQLLDLETLLVPMNKRALAQDEEEEDDDDSIEDEEFLPE